MASAAVPMTHRWRVSVSPAERASRSIGGLDHGFHGPDGEDPVRIRIAPELILADGHRLAGQAARLETTFVTHIAAASLGWRSRCRSPLRTDHAPGLERLWMTAPQAVASFSVYGAFPGPESKYRQYRLPTVVTMCLASTPGVKIHYYCVELQVLRRGWSFL
jgi:hypothetical protein